MNYNLQQKSMFDAPLFFTALALWIFGICLVYSATNFLETGPLVGIYKAQILWVSLAVVIMLVMVSLPGNLLYSLAWVMYGFSLLLLLYAEVTGVEAKGAARWIRIAGIRLQPSEFAKIGLLVGLARYFANRTISLERFSTLIVPGLLILVPFLLVLKQPDLGTAMVFVALSIPLFFWAGMSVLEIFYLVSPGISLGLAMIPLVISFTLHHSGGVLPTLPWAFFFLVVIGVLISRRPPRWLMTAVIAANIFTALTTTIIWGVLKDYQKMRIISFINPQQDAAGAGYQVIQSMVTIGSGTFLGKGYLKGTQIRLSYLPEQHTDFIFAVLGEQFGFLGCLLAIAGIFFVIYRGFAATQVVKSRHSNLLIVGAMSIVAFHVLINIAMVVGLMPVVGVPLPFLSYGGSFTFTIAICLAVVLSARMRRSDS